MATKLTRADIVDVTDQFEEKTAGGFDLIQAQYCGGILFSLISRGGEILAGRHNKNGHITAGSPFNLFPKKPARSPLERILPYVDHWWRDPTQLNGRGVLKITAVDLAIGSVKFEDWVSSSVLCNEMEHSASLENPQWENVP